MRLVLLVEGKTECLGVAPFLKRWLDARVVPAPGLQVVGFSGWARLLADAPQRASDQLARDDVVGVVALLDLYGPEPPRDRASVAQRVDWLRDELEPKVNDERFAVHVAVHELEAWILADPSVLPAKVRAALPKSAERPESVDFDEPPARLLMRLYETHEDRRRGYEKVRHGARMLARADVDKAYAACPHLREMLDWMAERAAAGRSGTGGQ